jgi:uncharacterized phage protein (TIGR01671 family)|nr:MAG TPA: YopX protein [Caudoviricetes sp.]
MREILFKAKRKDNGKWVKGDAIHEPIGMSIRYEKNGMSVRVPVDPDTLCQYTGLTDKNGQKIWEYDICEMVYDGTIYIYVVVWDKTELDFKGTNGKENYGCNFEYLGCCEEIVVIGNIFDNPELLEAM